MSVWFDCNPEELAARSMSDENAGKTSHPFLRGLPLSERQRIFEKIIADRRAMYERAHIHITTGNKSVHTIVEEILGHPLMEKFRD